MVRCENTNGYSSAHHETMMSLLQKLIMEHIGRVERARFMSKRVFFQPFKAYKKNFYALFWAEDKSIFSLCDLCGLCGETIAFLQ